MEIVSQKLRRFVSLLLCAAALSGQSSFAARTISSVADDGQTQEAGVSPATEELAYQTDPFTGAFSYSVPIKLPPARNGLAPKLALTYNSGGADSWVGWGWSLSAGYIEYDTRDGVPILPGPNPQYTGARFICVMNGKTVRLAPVGGPLGEYRAQIETDFSKYAYDGTSWIVTDKNGIKYYFGTTLQARLVNPNITGNGTFHWGLERVLDPNGNEISYSYGKYMHYTGRNAIAPLYLKTIEYNRHISSPSAKHLISFGVQTRGAGYSSSSARMGVIVQSDYVLSSLNVMCVGADGGYVASYGYRFLYSNPGSRTLLRAIEEAIPGQSLPGLARFEFDYTESERRFENVKDWGPLQSQGQTSGAWNSIRARNTGADTYLDLRDMNGDGLPDRVMRKAAAPFDNIVVQLNTGTGFGSQENWFLGGNRGHTTSAWGGIAAIGADFDAFLDLLDVNDDGLPDRLYREPNVAFPSEYSLYVVTNSGYASTGFEDGPLVVYDNQIDNPGGNAAWGSIQAGNLATYVDMFDINGDGAADRVTRKYSAPYDSFSVQLAQRTIHSGHPSVDWRASAQFGGLSSQAQTTAAWNSITSMDTNGHVYVGMFDINGDGLPDRVMRKVSSPYDRFLVQINSGWRFESPIEWVFTGAAASVGWGSVVGRSNGAQITLLADLDGDGLIDRVKRNAAPYDSFSVEKNTNLQFKEGGGVVKRCRRSHNA